MSNAMSDPMSDPTRVPRPGEPGAPAGAKTPGLGILRVARAVVWFVYAVVTACLVILFLGFVMRLFGASTDAEFTRWVYRNVERIMEPFRGMFPSPAITDRSVVDFSLLFAMIVYAIVAIGLQALVGWLAGKIAAAQRPPARPRPAAGPQPWSQTTGRPAG
jgi:uncharacterized protein YggT (Ycf19 family)